jgi:hypothetical protein
MRQQVAALYKEHLEHAAKAQEADKRAKAETEELRGQVCIVCVCVRALVCVCVRVS